MPAFKVSQIATLVATLAVTTIGGYAGYLQFAPKPTRAAPIITADVNRGTITATVSATGSVATPAQSKLGFKSGGRLTQLLVNVGDQVAEGQPLAKIDDSDLQVALVQAQANYNSAVAKLDQTKAGSRPEDIAAAQAQVDQARIKLAQTQGVPNSPDMQAAQAQLDSAKSKLAQVQAGGTADDVSAAQAQLDAANAKLQALQNPSQQDLANAQSQVNSAQSKLQALLNPRPEDIKNAQAQVVSAQAKLQGLTHPRQEDIAAAQSQVDQAKTKLAQLQDMPKTATPQDIANAQLAVQNAQVAYDKALADAAATTAGGIPAAKGTSAQTQQAATQADADAAIKQALLNLQTAQNNLGKLQAQGPSEWDIRQAQESVTAAQANLDKIQHPAPTDVQQAQAAVDQAQTNLDKITKPSPYDVQQAQESVNQAQTNLDKLQNPSAADIAAAQQAITQAQTNINKLQNPSDFDVQQAQQAVVQAQAGLDKILNQNRYDVQTAQSSLGQTLSNLTKLRNGNTVQDIAVAMAAVDQANAQLQQAQTNLDAATLTAPYAGVVAATGANLGEQVGNSTAMVTLVDTHQVRVDVVVDETDVAKVQPGQDVQLTFEALPGQQFNGKVSVVAPTGTVTQGVVNYTVQIQLDPAKAQGIRPGMTATATIVTASKDNAVLVPNRAIKTQGRAKTVQVLDEQGKTQTLPVQIGMANDQVTEITGGLQPGARVVIPTTTTAAARVPGLGGPGGPGGGAVFVGRGG